MRGVFTVALAVILALALVAPAMADSKVKFKGDYRVQWRYFNNLNLSDNSENELKQSYIQHRWRMYFQIMPTDMLTMNIALDLRDAIWGSNVKSFYYPTGVVGAGPGTGVFEFRYLFMDIKTQWGIFSLGRMATGVSGLTMLGYSGSDFTPSEVFDGEISGDRVQWLYSIGPLMAYAAWDKSLEGDRTAVGVQDQDIDFYTAGLIYKFSFGAMEAHSTYIQNRNDITFSLLPGGSIGKRDQVDLQGALMLTFGPFAFHGEAQYITGKSESMVANVSDIDVEGLGFYADVTWNYGPGMVGLQYAWFQGDDRKNANKDKDNRTSGVDFTPFFIATDQGLVYLVPTATYNATALNNIAMGLHNGLNNQANYSLLGLWVDHNLTENLVLHGAVGYLTILEAGRNVDTNQDIDNHYGTEFDIGLRYKIMKNLTTELLAGYFWPGNYFKFGANNISLGSAYAVQNTLEMKF